jgi:hypothetical protein
VLNLCVVLLALVPSQSGGLRITPQKDGTLVEVTATLPEGAKLPIGKITPDDGEAWLTLHLLTGDKEGPAMLGSYSRRGDAIVFVPRVPLQPEKHYSAHFTPPGGKVQTTNYKVPPRAAAPAAEVKGVWPPGDVLPANHLRFYIQFSRPMRGGDELYDHIYLLDSEGNKVTSPWLPDELWDETGTILTLYIHPGRIKWGVLLRILLGAVLDPERTYTLVVGGELLDADGRKLGKDYRKTFKTVAEDRNRIELSKWKLTAPKAGGTGPLVVAFGKAMDQVSTVRMLKVTDVQGKAIEGKAMLSADGRTWTFTPGSAWGDREYRLVADEHLEDPCGNTPLRPFDVDADAAMPAPQSLTLTFRPGRN